MKILNSCETFTLKWSRDLDSLSHEDYFPSYKEMNEFINIMVKTRHKIIVHSIELVFESLEVDDSIELK